MYTVKCNFSVDPGRGRTGPFNAHSIAVCCTRKRKHCAKMLTEDSREREKGKRRNVREIEGKKEKGR